MNHDLPASRLRIHYIVAALLCFLWLSGCGPNTGGGSIPAQAVDPTPTIDMVHAQEALNARGALTYGEIAALKHEMVGDAPDLQTFGNDLKKYRAAQSEYDSKLSDFDSRLDKGSLKESTGYVAYWWQETTEDYKPISGKMRLYLYMSDPYTGAGKNLEGPPDIYLTNLNDEGKGKLKYGQRVQVSGDISSGRGQIEVQNGQYTLLDDDLPVAAPTDEELKDLTVVLERGMCYGTCPAYSLIVEPDGKVSFEGKQYTGVKGPANGNLSKDQMIELAREITKADFFGLRDEYRANVTDLPTYTLTVQMGGRKKTVLNYAAGPRRLYLLESRVDQITNSSQWTSCGPDPCDWLDLGK